MKFSALFILLLALDVAARDPFSPAGDGQCSPIGESDAPLRLQGIIGRPDHYEAWLIASSARLHVGVNDRPVGTGWRVMQIDMQGITLEDEQGCRPPLRLTLKGERRVKENSAGSDSD